MQVNQYDDDQFEEAELAVMEAAMAALEAGGRIYELLYTEEVQLKVLMEDAAHLSVEALAGWVKYFIFSEICSLSSWWSFTAIMTSNHEAHYFQWTF